MKMITSVLLLLISSTSSALSIEGYEDQLADQDKQDDPIAQLSLTAYHRGISEAVRTISRAQGGTLFYEGNPFICIPKTASIDELLIESTMRAQLKNQEPIRATFGDDFKKYDAFWLAFIGLWRTFPCPKVLQQ